MILLTSYFTMFIYIKLLVSLPRFRRYLLHLS